MKLENQVCTLDQAKELKELGLELESYFVWGISRSEEWKLIGRDFSVHVTYPDRKIHPAYSGTELGVLLGEHNCLSTGIVLEAKLRADKLIHLLKEKIIKPEDLKL